MNDADGESSRTSEATVESATKPTSPQPTRAQRRERAWLAERTAAWQRLAADVAQLERGRHAPPEVVLGTVQRYPEVAGDLATARRAAAGSAAARGLEGIYARLHASLFAPPSHLGHELGRLFRREVPAIMAELQGRILVMALGFFLAAAAGAWLVESYPGLARLFASSEMVAGVERGELWTDDLLNILPSSVLSVQIFANNIAVTVAAFCLGTIYGLGTLYIVGLNGLMLGSLVAFTAQHGMHGRLLEFAAAHGFVELSVIFIAAAAGFSIGEAIARPAHRTRTEAFSRAVSRGGKLLLPCALLLVGAGLIEGYVSPDPRFPLWARLVIGIGYWAVMAWVLAGLPLGWRSGSAAAGEGKP